MANPNDPQSFVDGMDPAAIPIDNLGYTSDDYRLISILGEGSFGKVWKAERDGFEVALKVLKSSMDSDETKRELKSLAVVKRLHHKFLLKTMNYWTENDELYIEMELAEGGTLKERLKAYKEKGEKAIPAEELLKYFTETAQALDYLHSHRPNALLHRDIKPANILLVKDKDERQLCASWPTSVCSKRWRAMRREPRGGPFPTWPLNRFWKTHSAFTPTCSRSRSLTRNCARGNCLWGPASAKSWSESAMARRRC